MALHTLLLSVGLLAMALVAPEDVQEAEGLSARFRSAARAVQPAVVSVEGRVRMAPAPAPLVPPTRIHVPGVDITAPGLLGPSRVGDVEIQTGSGVVLDAERGLVLTADHVVAQSQGLVVTLPDGQERPVSAVVRDPESDLALLTIAPGGLTEATWGDSDALDLGDWVLTVGSPFGLRGSISAGIVSGKARAIHERRFEDLIQTDAQVYPGSSGGPLVNLRGEIVGVVIALQGERERGPGFAIPARRVRRVAADLALVGHVRRAFLGVRLSEAEGPERPGVLVSAVEPGTPAELAGLRPGDVIMKVGDRQVSTAGQIRAEVEFAEIGKPLPLTVLRGEETLLLEIVPAEQPVRGPAPEPEILRPVPRP